jgi:hypothetical protein
MWHCRPEPRIGYFRSAVGLALYLSVFLYLYYFSPALSVNSSSISLPSGSSSYAAIDTGTTLVGGPRSVISRMFDQIPGSQAGTGNFEGYYTYRAFRFLFITQDGFIDCFFFFSFW